MTSILEYYISDNISNIKAGFKSKSYHIIWQIFIMGKNEFIILELMTDILI